MTLAKLQLAVDKAKHPTVSLKQSQQKRDGDYE